MGLWSFLLFILGAWEIFMSYNSSALAETLEIIHYDLEYEKMHGAKQTTK
jgi:hypothetical protein